MSDKTTYDYDLLVIGSGPSGQKAAIQAAKLKKRVAVVEFNHDLGGVCTNTGTIPSKSFREAVLYLTGFRERSLYGSSYRVKSRISMEDLTYRISTIVKQEIDIIDDQLRRNSVDILLGRGKFIDPHTVEVVDSAGNAIRKTAEYIVIAVGTNPYHPSNFDLSHPKVHDSDTILTLKEIPTSLVVIGGGIIGCEYATWFSLLGIDVTLVEARERLMQFADTEIVDTLTTHLEDLGMTVVLGSGVEEVTELADGQLQTRLSNSELIVSDSVLVSAGRQGATKNLGLEDIGLNIAKYGRLKVNENFQTEIPHIYAVGDVIGFPALASSGMLQGRSAAVHIFDLDDDSSNVPLPFGIWTIPEIAMVGETTQSLEEQGIAYEVGRSFYKEIARGKLIGDEHGMLKLLFHKETQEILGIHIIGGGAIEILHLGQAVLHLGGTLQYFISSVFNYPTLGECYRVAALDGFNKLNGNGS